MQRAAIQRILGVLLMILSVSMLPPIAVSLYYKDGTILSFVLGFVSTFFAGLILWFPVRNYHREMRLRDGFIVVAMFWLVLGVCGAIPFVLASNPNPCEQCYHLVCGKTDCVRFHNLQSLFLILQFLY